MTGRLTSGVMWDIKASYYLRKRPGRPFAHVLMGWVRLSLGDPVAADRHFDDAISKEVDYSLAYTGKICAAVFRRRFRDAGRLLLRYAARLRFDRRTSITILYGALSIIANDMVFKGKTVPFMQKSLRDEGHAQLKFIRYIELLYRGTKTPDRDTKNTKERRRLARDMINLPGICDSFRKTIARDAMYTEPDTATGKSAIGGASNGISYFTFDRPVDIAPYLLNRLFTEYVYSGIVQKPRLILMGLRKDGAFGYINNRNKWLFLKLCHNTMRNDDVTVETANELYNAGWWADPLVRSFLNMYGGNEHEK